MHAAAYFDPPGRLASLIATMPKLLSEFTFRDWLHLKPVVHNYKHARFLSVYAIVLRRPALVGDTERIISAVAHNRLLTTISFHDADKIALTAHRLLS
jgi:hypothetical protein